LNQMPYHLHARRKKTRKSHGLLLLGSALIVSATVLAMVPSTHHRFAATDELIPTEHHESEWDRWNSSIPAMVSASEASRSHSGRTVYPYSVIPGGVGDARGLREAVSRDAVVAAHYSGFNLASAQVVRLGAARTVYVSYRLGNKVYWTRKKVKLASGETVITDGEHFARARCGNRITESPGGESSPAEPIAEVLDRSVDSSDPLPDPNHWPGVPRSNPLQMTAYRVPDSLIPVEGPMGSADGFMPPGSGPGGNPGGSLPPISPSPILYPPGPTTPPIIQPLEPQAAVPEPGTILLLSSGVSALLALRRKIKQ
jgi:hypothetical protein